MSDVLALNPIEKVSDSEVVQISAGSMLKSARQAEGLQLSDLAVSLKVPVKKLEALEADLFDLLPDVVFTRALAASVCRTLKIDSTLILDRLPNTERPNLKTDEEGINAPFRASGSGTGLVALRLFFKPSVAIVFILLLGVLAMFFLPATPLTQLTELAKPEAAPPLFPLVETVHSPTIKIMPVSGGAIQTEQPTLSNSMATSPQQDAPAASLAASVGRSASVPILAGSAPETRGKLVVFTGRGTSWIEVVDKQGAVQVRKTIQSGEVIEASGVLPLTVVVGRADTTDVQVRGKPFDLLQISKDNVARFEVK
jgi:cytoskeleton protein RodZ